VWTGERAHIQLYDRFTADSYRKLTLAIHTDLHKIHDGLADLKMSTSAIMNTAAVIKNQTIALHDDATIQRKREILEWICPGDYSIQHRDYIDRRQPDTGEWFLQSPRYQEWVQSEQSTLFCPGMPGAGKTIMAALVIDQLLRSEHEADRPVVFIYCSYKRQNEQSLKHMLSTLLRQVVDVQGVVPSVVQEFRQAHARKRTTPSTQELEQILGEVTKHLLGMTVLIDALDECEAEVREDLLSLIETLQKQCKIRVLATSRDLPEIKSHFLGEPTLEVRASNQDLEKKVRSRIRRFWLASNPDLLETVVISIVKAAGGM
jgi:Cdc6-like AAA superfamily ATPase